jgi:hypothetical protein
VRSKTKYIAFKANQNAAISRTSASITETAYIASNPVTATKPRPAITGIAASVVIVITQISCLV